VLASWLGMIPGTVMYDRDARERGIEVDTYVRNFKEVDRAVLDGEDDGFVKLCGQNSKWIKAES